LALLWLVYIASAIWQHVQTSEQPLVYDALSYWLKARNVWECLLLRDSRSKTLSAGTVWDDPTLAWASADNQRLRV
jgi:hypothetical protein